MKAKTAYIRYSEEYNEWQFKLKIDYYDDESTWTKIVYFELEE